MSIDPIEGGCLCRSTRYRITGAPVASSICHCRSCRRASGAPSVAWVVVPIAGFSFVAEPPAAFRSSQAVSRTFCRRCGTPLTYRHDDDVATIDVTTATLDEPDGFAPKREIWIDHKIVWSAVNPTLPHFRTTRAAASDDG